MDKMRYVFVDTTVKERGPEKFLKDILLSKTFNNANSILLTNKEHLIKKQEFAFAGLVTDLTKADKKFFASEECIFICNNLSSFFASYKIVKKRKTVIFFHNEYLELRNKLKLLFLYFSQEVYFFCVSSFNCGLLYSGKFFSKYSVQIIPNFITTLPPTLPPHPKANRLELNKMNVCYIGSAYPKKGFDVFFNVAKNNTNENIAFHVIGFTKEQSKDGLMRANLHNDTKTLEKIIFHGRVSDVRNILSSMDILLATSPLESFGRTTLEAIDSNVLVVCSENPGYMSVLTPLVNCYTFPVGDHNKAGKIIQFVYSNGKEVKPIMKNAKELLKYYNSEVICEKIKMRLDEFLKGKRPEARWNSGDKVVNIY